MKINQRQSIKKNIKSKKTIKLLELFGGIGAPRKALESLGVSVKSIDYVEVLPHAVKAYNAMYDTSHKEQNILDWNLNVDLLVHGSPCQDFSTAGKNDLSTGRSILYLRTLEIIEKDLNPRPKYVVWENVKGLINKNNFAHFQHYLDTLESLGYKNYWKVLNAKDFGIPQNRERVFVISIRQDLEQTFNFDNLETSEMRPLKSFLTDSNLVDEKYFLSHNSPSMIKAVETGKISLVEDHVYTVSTRQFRWNNAGVVKIPLTTFNQENYVVNPEDANSHLKTVTATGEFSRQKVSIKVKEYNNFLVVPRASDGKLINGSYNRIWDEDKFVGALNATTPIKVKVKVKETDNSNNKKAVFLINGIEYYLRVITPQEAWKLMAFTDNDYQKIKDLPQGAKYALAGNSIVVSVLEAIFKELLQI